METSALDATLFITTNIFSRNLPADWCYDSTTGHRFVDTQAPEQWYLNGYLTPQLTYKLCVVVKPKPPL